MTQNIEQVAPEWADEPAGPVAVARPPAPARYRRPRSWWSRPWMIPLVGAVAGFLIYTLPDFLTFDPNKAKVQLNKAVPLHYPLLLLHIGFGTIALLTVCLQVWPWLRTRHPAVHRASGRMYVFAGVIPASLLALTVSFLHIGWHADIGSVLQAGLWLVVTIVGYRAIRRRDYVAHRRWMLYSFAFATSILWGLPVAVMWQHFLTTVDFSYAAEFSRWGSWVINLALVQWWLERTANRPLAMAPRPTPGLATSSAGPTC